MKLETRLEVPEKVKRLLRNPTPAINRILKKADKRALTFLQKEISKAAPRGKTGDLARSIEVDLIRRKITSSAVYARAVELGHYAEADEGKYLRFEGSGQRTGTHVYPTSHFRGTKGTIFGQWVSAIRTEKQPYFFSTLSKNQVNIINIYEKEFRKLLRSL